MPWRTGRTSHLSVWDFQWPGTNWCQGYAHQETQRVPRRTHVQIQSPSDQCRKSANRGSSALQLLPFSSIRPEHLIHPLNRRTSTWTCRRSERRQNSRFKKIDNGPSKSGIDGHLTLGENQVRYPRCKLSTRNSSSPGASQMPGAPPSEPLRNYCPRPIARCQAWNSSTTRSSPSMQCPRSGVNSTSRTYSSDMPSNVVTNSRAPGLSGCRSA